MCPLRIILVFLSATLAGYLAWTSMRAPDPSPFELPGDEVKEEKIAAEKDERPQFGKVTISLSLSPSLYLLYISMSLYL